ncbi:DUF1800 domain-containing protein [Lysobacter capsici]|uniref:DUF1800 domain-containing protein n=1 Tax=Lysobacter capsici TaxID=435897 RepID=UPI00069C8380|nr:DUF1800 domain-containing protein [Lysobacter capsici]
MSMPRVLLLLGLVVALRTVAPTPDYAGPYPGASERANANGATNALGMAPAPRVVSDTVASDAEAARFLAQATFGPTLEDIARLRQIGYSAWINEQVGFPVSSQLTFMKNAAQRAGTGDSVRRDWRLDAWFVNALGGKDPIKPTVLHRDQLRQRVAFALSEIFVVSDATSDLLGNAPHGMTHYYDTLARDAFGNFRTLLEDVTLHPVMGIYLSMMQNQKPDPVNNIRPDENYAREVLQLFSVGLVRLNADGTPLLDANQQPIPAYDQDTVKGFAHVFTGWTFNGCQAQGYFDCYYYDSSAPAWVTPMENQAAYHASAQAKQLLNYTGVSLPGGVLAAGGSGRGDLDAALDNIFRHPNVGPFIGRQLIQRLVTSNPSPAYVGRVAAAFNDNGQGVRGDLRAVVTAVLMDAEARDPASQPEHFGKVREPILRLTHLWRALNAKSKSGFLDEFWTLDGNLGQSPMYASSVFNFFSPRYSPIGEISQLQLAAPELQLATDYMLPANESYLMRKIFDAYVGNPGGIGDDEIAINLSRDLALATNPGALIDRYNTLFLSGQMSAPMRQVLLERLNGMPANTTAAKRERVQEALYLIVNSPEYVVQK